MDIIDSEAQDRADMVRLAQGHDAALNELMDRHAGPIFRFLYRMVGNEDDANDLAQEAFVRVYKHRDRFRPAEKFSTWLYAIAANLARNHHRWRGRHPNVSLDAEDESTGRSRADLLTAPGAEPGDSLVEGERHRAVRAAVDALPDKLRDAVVLCEWEERSMAEAAAILGTPVKTIESRLYRARQMLRDRLGRWLVNSQ